MTYRPAAASFVVNGSSQRSMEAPAPWMSRTAGWPGSPMVSMQSSAPLMLEVLMGGNDQWGLAHSSELGARRARSSALDVVDDERRLVVARSGPLPEVEHGDHHLHGVVGRLID